MSGLAWFVLAYTVADERSYLARFRHGIGRLEGNRADAFFRHGIDRLEGSRADAWFHHLGVLLGLELRCYCVVSKFARLTSP